MDKNRKTISKYGEENKILSEKIEIENIKEKTE